MIVKIFNNNYKQSIIARKKLISKLSTTSILVTNRKKFDIGIIIGGDGSFLSAIQENISQLDKIKFIGIHSGHLGFYSNYTINEIDEIVTNLKNSVNYNIENFQLIKCIIKNFEYYALNEIKIINWKFTLKCEVIIQNTFLENFQGTGLCFSTSSGSTGFNKSIGGSILVPSINSFIFKEIAPATNNLFHSINSSLILPNKYNVKLSGDFNYSKLFYDREVIALKESKNIEITMSKKKVQIINFKNKKISFIERVRSRFVL